MTKLISKYTTREFLRWAAGIPTKSDSKLGKYRGGALDIRSFYKKALIAEGIVARRGAYKGNNMRLMVCPLHEDSAPSMGTIIDADGLEIFNCFGCKRAGTVVDMAEGVRRLDTEEALKWVLRTCGGSKSFSELDRFISVVGNISDSDGISDDIDSAVELSKESLSRKVNQEYERIGKNSRGEIPDKGLLMRNLIISLDL